VKVLVTGSAGFIAGYLVEDLLAHGHEVVGIDNLSKYGEVSKSYDGHPRYRFVRGDAKDTALLKDLVRDCDQLIALAAMIGEVLLALLWSAGRLRPVVRDVLYRQVYFTGVRAIPFAAFLSLLVATMVAVQAPYSAAAGGNILGSVLVVVLVRELGPLAAALIVVTRSGTAMAAELATMGVSGETDGLAGMGVEPFEYLVLPRLVGTAISLVALTVLFLATSIFTSALLSPLLNGPSPGPPSWPPGRRRRPGGPTGPPVSARRPGRGR